MIFAWFLSLIPLAAAADFAIVGATVLPISGPIIQTGNVLVRDGKIAAVGADVLVPDGMATVQAEGQYLMPGIIDVHSHMGVYPWPSAKAHGDGNEAVSPITARVRAEDSVHVSDPAFERARAGGVTTIQVLPGSANLVGGEAAILKLRRSRTLAGMKFTGAPRGIKMACGENPKRVYGSDENGPQTRMGNVAYLRAAFQSAQDHRTARLGKDPPPRDANLQTLLDVLDGKVRVHVHCYRHDDIEGVFRLMDEFGVSVSSIQHALEAYKVRDLILAHGTGIATWADWWGFKMEAFDGIPHNAAMVKAEGVPVAIHSDSSNQVQRLNVQASKTLRYGMSEADALETITRDPARILGLEDRVGTIEVGKDADFAMFSGHPLDVYSLNTATWIDGIQVYDRNKEGTPDARP
jgi:imidazolonepropionase-like amidohydrolase